MIHVVCKQNEPHLEYRHASLEDGYYPSFSISWEEILLRRSMINDQRMVRGGAN